MLLSKKLLLVVFSLLPCIYSSTLQAQQWKWVVNGSGTNQYSNADRDIAVDNNGTQFIAGYFTETLTLGAFTLTSPDDYYSDLFMAKIDSSGNVIWARAFDLGSSYNDALGICLDDSSNIYVTGAYNSQIFVSKYDSSGALKWNSNILQKTYYGYGRDVAVDQYENVYITGQESGNAIVAKLDRNGGFLWSSKIQSCSSNGAWGNDLAVDRLGNSYMAGGFSCDSVVVGSTVLRRTSGSATFLAKYSPDGAVAWAKLPVGPTNTIPQVAVTDSGYVILAGSFGSSPVYFDNIIVSPLYQINPYIAKYNANGSVIWAKHGGKYESTPRDIAVDYDGNTYLGGIRFGNYGGTYMDFHLIKYNNNGDTVYTREVLPGDEYLYGTDIDNFGNTHLVGHADVKGLGVIGLSYSQPYSVFSAKFNTGSTTRRRPAKPLLQSLFTVCAGSSVPELFAPGNNIKWYKDNALLNLLASGNAFTPAISKTDTLYVTQTEGGIPSWPKQVIVYISQLTDFSITYRNDSLLAPGVAGYTYQWYLNNAPVADNRGGRQPGIKPAEAGTYKVVVSDQGVCSKEATYAYTALPLTYLSFTAVKNGAAGIVHWKIAKEADTKSFELEKSSDGTGFTPLTYIPKTDDSKTEFTYTDNSLLHGNNYYRLKEFSRDGKTSFSPIILLANKPVSSLQLYPNPVRDKLLFSFAGGTLPANCSIKIFGAAGNMVYSSVGSIRTTEPHEISVGFLQPGAYFFELFDGKQTTYSAYFMKR